MSKLNHKISLKKSSNLGEQNSVLRSFMNMKKLASQSDWFYPLETEFTFH